MLLAKVINNPDMAMNSDKNNWIQSLFDYPDIDLKGPLTLEVLGILGILLFIKLFSRIERTKRISILTERSERNRENLDVNREVRENRENLEEKPNVEADYACCRVLKWICIC